MNQEDRNNFVIPLPHWVARYIPHPFFTPQHILETTGKKDRQIFDASGQYTLRSTPINMMMSTPFGSEEPCLFGSTKEEISTRIYTPHADNPSLDGIAANEPAYARCRLVPNII